MAKYLEENTSIKIIELKDALLKAKEKEQVYFKTDTHWNESGAYIGYQTIINQLNKFDLIDSMPAKVNKIPSSYKGEFAGNYG